MRRGINRPDIEATLREAVIRLTGFAPDSVFFSEHAVDTAACPRPCVSMTILPYETQRRSGTQSRQPGLELTRLVISSSADGTYAIDIDGVTYSHAAVGETATQIRDALLGVINAGAHPNFTATGLATATIDLASQVPGYRLRVENASAGVTTFALRGNIVKIVSSQALLRVELSCVGSFANPLGVEMTGVDIAERLGLALLDNDDTTAMRDAEHNVVTVRVTDQRRVVDGQEETIGVVDAILATDSLHITTISDARSAPMTFAETA